MLSTPQSQGLKLSFYDRHFKEATEEEARYVKLEYVDKGHVRWRAMTLAQNWSPEVDYTDGSLDCVMVECRTDGCPWKDHRASIHAYLDKNHKVILLEPHNEPMCDHMWARFCADMDTTFKAYRKQFNTLDLGKGTTQRIP